MSENTSPTVEVGDAVFAKLAAFEAAQTPGVARLRPYVIQAARHVANAAAKRAAAKLIGAAGALDVASTSDAVDPTAVDVAHDADANSLTLTIRIVASMQLPILTVVRDLQQRINVRVTEITGVTPVVVVNVLDIDPR